MIDPAESAEIWDRGFVQGYDKAIHFIANQIKPDTDSAERQMKLKLIKELQEFGDGFYGRD